MLNFIDITNPIFTSLPSMNLILSAPFRAIPAPAIVLISARLMREMRDVMARLKITLCVLTGISITILASQADKTHFII